MTQQTFSLGAIPKSAAPELPAPLNSDEFHTRQQIRDHQAAQLAYYDFQRDVEYQIKVAADNARAKELAEAHREQTDFEYDEMKRKQWQAAKDKQAALLQKEKDDEMEKIAYLLTSPDIAEIFTRTEYTALKSVIHWANRGYTMPEEGFHSFSHGVFHIQMTAPAKKVAK